MPLVFEGWRHGVCFNWLPLKQNFPRPLNLVVPLIGCGPCAPDPRHTCVGQLAGHEVSQVASNEGPEARAH